MQTKIRSTIIALVAALSLAAAAGPASAQPNGPVGKPGKCPVEDANGNVTYVDKGTRIGMFVCGGDGEWHFGWLITARVKQISQGIALADAPLHRVSRAR